jgi:hypothetical protein
MTRKILLQQLGENATTAPDPVADVLSQHGDTVTALWPGETTPRTISLQEKQTCCLACDNDLLVSVPKYAVTEMDLPEWMSPNDFLYHQTAWRYFKGFGGQADWPRPWFFRLSKLGEAQKYAAIQLLKVRKFRSRFRQQLRSQLETWLNEPEPRFPNPFSRKQWNCLLNAHVCLAAKQRSNAIYWSR